MGGGGGRPASGSLVHATDLGRAPEEMVVVRGQEGMVFIYCDSCFNVYVGCVHIVVIAIVIMVAVVVAIVIAIAVMIVIAFLLRQGLSFLSTSFTLAFRLDMSLLAAIVTFNCAIHLPVLSCKGLIWAILALALGNHASIILICNDFSDTIRGDGLAGVVQPSKSALRVSQTFIVVVLSLILPKVALGTDSPSSSMVVHSSDVQHWAGVALLMMPASMYL